MCGCDINGLFPFISLLSSLSSSELVISSFSTHLSVMMDVLLVWGKSGPDCFFNSLSSSGLCFSCRLLLALDWVIIYTSCAAAVCFLSPQNVFDDGDDEVEADG